MTIRRNSVLDSDRGHGTIQRGALNFRPQLVARFWIEDRDDIVLLAEVEHLWRGDYTVTMSLTNVEIDNHPHVQLLFSHSAVNAA